MAGGAANPGLFAAALAEDEQRRRGYGQFTGYAPIPGAPGAYNFQTATGQNVPFVGAPAEQLRGQIDAARGAPAPQQAMTIATTKDGGRLGVKEGEDPRNIANYMVETPGSRGRKAGMVAQGMTSQGGYAVDEQFLGQMEESKLRQAAAEEQSLQQGIATAAERQSFMKGQQQQLEREAAVQAHENQVKQQRLGDLQAKYDRAEQDFMSFHADKEAERESPKAKLATFIGGLAGALGALGATLGRTPNFAAEAVARHNEMQLRREEAELRVKKDAKDSLLGRLQQEMGSLDLARNAYRAIQSRQSALGWEALAQKEQDQQRQATMLRASEIHNQEYLKWREAYTRGAEGEITRTFRFDPGASASGPRRRAPTLEEHKQLKELLQADATLDKTRAEARRTGETRQAPHERTTAISGMAAAIGAANRIEGNLTKRGMGKDTTIDDPLSGGWDALGEGVSALGIAGDSKKTNDALRADTFEMARGLQLAYGKSDNDAIMANEQAAGSANGADRLRAARSTKQRAINNIKTELSTMPEDQQRRILSTMDPDVVDAILDKERK